MSRRELGRVISTRGLDNVPTKSIRSMSKSTQAGTMQSLPRSQLRIGTASLVFLAILLCRSNAQTTFTQTNGLPQCAVLCANVEIPKICGTEANLTCVCTNDFVALAIQNCVQASCSVTEALQSARINDESCGRPPRSRKLEIVMMLTIEIPAWLSIWLRMYSRWTTMHKFAWDDYIMMAGGVLFAAFVAVGQLAVHLGFGVDMWMVDPNSLTAAFMYFYIDESLYIIVLAMSKISLLLFSLRIFPHRAFRLAAVSTLGFVCISLTIILLLQIFQCIPITYNWEWWKLEPSSSKCLDINALSFGAACVGIAQDLIILILPLPLISRLKMSYRDRIAVALMFSLGGFIVITSCIRLHYIVSFSRSSNSTWDNTSVLVWSCLEVSVSVIVTSLPAIRVLIMRSMPGVLSTIEQIKRGSGLKSPSNVPQELSEGFSGAKGRWARSQRHFSKHAKDSVFPARHRYPQYGNESDLELGHRANGDVHTEIGVDDGPSVSSLKSIGSRIYVSTITTLFNDDMDDLPFGVLG